METLQTKSESWGERKGIPAGAAAEVMFAVLPLLVVAMVLLHKEHSTALLASPEWSFGAAILFGQSVVKFMTSLARGGKAHNRDRKSTRLNSSHANISYAVFCLTKKRISIGAT